MRGSHENQNEQGDGEKKYTIKPHILSRSIHDRMDKRHQNTCLTHFKQKTNESKSTIFENIIRAIFLTILSGMQTISI